MNETREELNAEDSGRQATGPPGLPRWLKGLAACLQVSRWGCSAGGVRQESIATAPARAFHAAGWVLLFGLVTLLTQVGGIIGVAAWWLSGRWWKPKRIRAAFVAGTYLLATLWIIPMVARPTGRVPLPVVQGPSVPLTARAFWFWLANRHYVNPEVREVVVEAARKLAAKHPGTVVHYLDGGFPFWDGFAMLPHWSHGKGEAVDLTFCYHRGRDGTEPGLSPSPIGYGIYEGPRAGEPQPYRGKFSWLRWDFPWIQGMNRGNRLDEEHTRDLIRYLVEDGRTSKVLVELHLQERLGLAHRKLRFQQLQAARHDDHLHVVVR